MLEPTELQGYCVAPRLRLRSQRLRFPRLRHRHPRSNLQGPLAQQDVSSLTQLGWELPVVEEAVAHLVVMVAPLLVMAPLLAVAHLLVVEVVTHLLSLIHI